MKIQNTNQPTFGKLFMPSYTTLEKKFGIELATVLEKQRPAAEKAASKCDVYARSAYTMDNDMFIALEVAPLRNLDNTTRTTEPTCPAFYDAKNFVNSIKECIKENQVKLLSDTLVENNLGTKDEAEFLTEEFLPKMLRLEQRILEQQSLGNTRKEKKLTEQAKLAKQTLAKHGLMNKKDEKNMLVPNMMMVLKRIIKNNIPVEPVVEDLQNLNIITNTWFI